MYLLMIARGTDILSTWLSYNVPRDELMPVARFLQTNFGFGGFAIINLLMSFGLGLLLIKIKKGSLINWVTVASLIATVFNMSVFYYFTFLY